MSSSNNIAKNYVVPIALVALVGTALWLAIAPRPAKAQREAVAPAVLERLVQESELNRIRLTREAEDRLKLQLVKVERKPMPRVRVVGGEIMAPAGRDLAVVSPLAGLLSAPAGARLTPGQKVSRGDPIFQIMPIFTPEARTNLETTLVEAEGLIQAALTQEEVAQQAYVRAEGLRMADAVSQRILEEARGQFLLATRAKLSAVLKRDVLRAALQSFQSGVAAPIAIPAPDDGTLMTVSARPGQFVASGAPLFSLVYLDQVWVRVPMYVGDIATIDRAKQARVSSLGEWKGPAPLVAEPIADSPPKANFDAASVDLYYSVANPTERLIPGQRVAIHLPLRGEERPLVIPWSAVLVDLQGGGWVYEKLSEHTYSRRPVIVRHVIGAEAVLDLGPPVGAEILAQGGAELFGAEVGIGKPAKGEVDDD